MLALARHSPSAKSQSVLIGAHALLSRGPLPAAVSYVRAPARSRRRTADQPVPLIGGGKTSPRAAGGGADRLHPGLAGPESIAQADSAGRLPVSAEVSVQEGADARSDCLGELIGGQSGVVGGQFG
nr:hypothetical protein GCM10020093_108910 [Planobispora longispora]